MARVDESITQFVANELFICFAKRRGKNIAVLCGVKLVFLSVREFMLLN